MTSIYDTIEVAHLVVVVYDEGDLPESSFGRWATRYRAECSCGWSGDWHDAGALAEADGDDHREVVIGPGDELDGLISELLDLQDDLAQAVMWLAEHWTADMPVPRVRGVGLDSANVELSVYCATNDELIRLAAVLGSPLVDDAEVDSCGNRYRHAERPFNRVLLKVFRQIVVDHDEYDIEVAGSVCPTCGEQPDPSGINQGAA